MKKTLVAFLIMLFSVINGYTQQAKTIESYQTVSELLDSIAKLRREICNLENKMNVSDSVTSRMFYSLAQSLNSKKNADDSRLRESLKSAESTINNQNTFIQIFGVIFGLIAIGAAVLYFFSFRPVVNQAEKALDRTNLATDKLESKIANFIKDVDCKISDRIELYEKTASEKTINEIFKDIESKLQNQRKLQIEKLSTLENSIFTSERIDRLFKVLDLNIISEYEKTIIIEVLIQIDNYQIQKYFEIWKNIKSEEVSIMNLLFLYYIKNGLINYQGPISSYILKKVEPHLEFTRLLDMLPSHPEDIVILLNCKEIINSLNEHSRTSIIEHVNNNLNSWNLVDKTKVNDSYLFQKG